jgi:hypothetical protein
MPGEYRFAVERALESVACLPDKTARTETKKMLRSLIESEAPEQRRSTAGAGLAIPSAAPIAAAPRVVA